MSRFMRQPFYRKSCKCWYVKGDHGQFIRLDSVKKTAFEIWRQMLGGKFAEGPMVNVRTLVRVYLQSHEHRKAEAKFKINWSYLNQFSAALGGKQVQHLLPVDVVKWSEEEKTKVKQWSPTTRKDAIRAVKTVFNWAKKRGKIATNPLDDLKCPAANVRTETISDEQHKMLVQAASPALRMYLIASRCGARPRQIREVTAREVSADGRCWIFKDHKTKAKTNRPLVVYLSPCLQSLTKMMIARHAKGPLFRNTRGGAWTKDSVSGQIRRLRTNLGLPSTVVAYSYRHTFATNGLLKGLSIAEVAELLGHSDVTMVSRVYGHLDKHRDHMISAAAKLYSDG
ncbi:MAG: tyrosine-type recombinase/integrase [Pirellulaceae bacterium]|nr:tyrosine-type recombinase/integrase [Pirellulaceae bacterium]